MQKADINSLATPKSSLISSPSPHLSPSHHPEVPSPHHENNLPPSLPPSLTYSTRSPTSSEHIDSHPSNEPSTPCPSLSSSSSSSSISTHPQNTTKPICHPEENLHHNSRKPKETSCNESAGLCVDRQALDGRKMPGTNSPSDHITRDGNSENVARAESICAG